jgi:MoaA/NifB/PqqE/SkfB family radical SAM enzyme
MQRSAGTYCGAIGRTCPHKNLGSEEAVREVRLRYLAIEPTTACDLRCLACPVRDFSSDITWRHAYKDGGLPFFLWDSTRRIKQHAADRLRRFVPPEFQKRLPSLLLRGRPGASRRGTLSIDVVKRVVNEAGPSLERIDFFNYGEPFIYRHLVDALRHIRAVLPNTKVAISTDGMQVRGAVEDVIIRERLLDWIVFSVDGSDERSYARYRIRGRFETAYGNMVRFHHKARGSGIDVTWQYVVFRWNDRDDQLGRALLLAAEHGIRLHFDFANTWGRSRRRRRELEWLRPHLKPFTAFPGEIRTGGW